MCKKLCKYQMIFMFIIQFKRDHLGVKLKRNIFNILITTRVGLRTTRLLASKLK